MSSHTFTESVVEDAARAWLESLGYAIKHGPEIAPGNFPNERTAEKSFRRQRAAVSAKNATVHSGKFGRRTLRISWTNLQLSGISG